MIGIAMQTEMGECRYHRDLTGDLRVRWSNETDADAIAGLYSHVFRAAREDPPNKRVTAWMRDMMSGRHPLIDAGDFALVEDASGRRIVSAACLISYEIEMEGMRIPFGRPEAVATHPDFRNRGLVRAIFELLHARSRSRGHLVQGITGIPYYYRQFGYEYAADLGGEASIYFAAIPPLKTGESEPYRLRDAQASDLDQIRAMYDKERARYAISAPLDARYWAWVYSGQDPVSGEGWASRLIEDPHDAVAGYALTGRIRDADEIKLMGLGTRNDVPMAAVMPSLLRQLALRAGDPMPKKADLPSPARVCLALGRDHPAYRMVEERQIARRQQPYAWYLRVEDLKGFLVRIRAILEKRLESSPLAGYKGELRLSFYRCGLRLAFEQGKLSSVEEWREDHAWGPRAQAGFPPPVFLKLLFGYQSLAELRSAFPDVRADDQARPLLEALFPRRPAWLLPLD